MPRPSFTGPGGEEDMGDQRVLTPTISPLARVIALLACDTIPSAAHKNLAIGTRHYVRTMKRQDHSLWGTKGGKVATNFAVMVIMVTANIESDYIYPPPLFQVRILIHA